MEISFPADSEEGLEQLSEGFSTSRGSTNPLPGRVGALGGIAISVVRPSRKETANVTGHWSRKGFHAVSAQAICDSNYLLRFVSYRCAGSTHDSTAWRVTSLSDALEAGRLAGDYYIAADEACKCSERILTPWPRAKTAFKGSFNFHLSSMRIHVEQAFGMLLNRWGALWKPLMIKLERSKDAFMARVKLHNFSLSRRGGQGQSYDGEALRVVERGWQRRWEEARPVRTLRRSEQGRRRDAEKSKKRLALTSRLMNEGIARPLNY
eukprot:Plantae.Rhodophyta-Hildenbrandia_rubra.ctg65334.p1 GENE.Plantae.Rhodophyta-Hildenbrandia_rubra.ctg65334~~Plantae.Rhodophyta-Hildenbrandia_rubra.ctg65334.p1  ORF type:complete len:280 (-),score=24.68 Plantae.Rhodophyta-Hildenbrandia_rubra.ctg65334:183-977(-)